MKIKKGDLVVMISGAGTSPEKPRTEPNPREVLQVLEGGQKVIVKGVNQVHKHVKRGHPKAQSGGRLHMEMPIQSSKIMYYCGACSRPTRLGLRYDPKGAKERYCKKCGKACGTVAPVKEKYATSK